VNDTTRSVATATRRWRPPPAACQACWAPCRRVLVAFSLTAPSRAARDGHAAWRDIAQGAGDLTRACPSNRDEIANCPIGSTNSSASCKAISVKWATTADNWRREHRLSGQSVQFAAGAARSTRPHGGGCAAHTCPSDSGHGRHHASVSLIPVPSRWGWGNESPVETWPELHRPLKSRKPPIATRAPRWGSWINGRDRPGYQHGGGGHQRVAEQTNLLA
jgi:hypothetical protein